MPREMLVKILTRNKSKFEEAKLILNEYGINVIQIPMQVHEIQSEDLFEIATFRLECALKHIPPPIATEDSGLFIDALNGFPGSFSSYVFKTIGCNGILKLMQGITNRKARFISVVAFADQNRKVHLFDGIVEGVISKSARGNYGFGFDPIFCPKERPQTTFAEMTREEKSKISHRSRAFRKLAKFLLASET